MKGRACAEELAGAFSAGSVDVALADGSAEDVQPVSSSPAADHRDRRALVLKHEGPRSHPLLSQIRSLARLALPHPCRLEGADWRIAESSRPLGVRPRSETASTS